MTKMSIDKFVELWNEQDVPLFYPDTTEEQEEEKLDSLDEWTEEMRNAFANTFDPEPRDYIGLSQIYMPLCLNLLSKHGITNKGKMSLSTKMHLLLGHVYEQTVLFWMRDEDRMNVTQEQQEVELHGLKGHIDLFLPDEDMVVDIKSMSGFYHKKFVDNPNDDRGYITQITSYRQALGCSRSAILAINKITNRMDLIEITDKEDYYRFSDLVDTNLLRKRVKGVAEILTSDTKINTVFQYPLEVITDLINKKVKKVPDSAKYDSRINYWVERDKYGNVIHQYDEEEVHRRIMRDYDVSNDRYVSRR